MAFLMSIDAPRIITILAFTNLVAKSMASMIPQVVTLSSIERRNAMVSIAPVTPTTQVKPWTQLRLADNAQVWRSDVDIQHLVNTLSLFVAYNRPKSVGQCSSVGKPGCCCKRSSR